ncbi:MAG: PTS sugar transporter subunit IIA [Chitinispirillaceae bacterium]|jgi:mannitol/fructose-specific phosphotransferase system IIA component (Ntr-type)
MKSLLTALDEGRLVELPDTDKNKALEYLALLIEAIPGIAQRNDIVQEVQKREISGNTGIGKGIACPHARRDGEGDLLCAIGWSPQGIDYDAPDKEKVHLVVMYYIPDSEKNFYLKEISSLAKAVEKTGDISSIIKAQDIHAVRNQLLDWVSLAIDAAAPEPKARMIKLQEREAAVAAAEAVGAKKLILIVPFSVVLSTAQKPIILTQDADFLRTAESQTTLPGLLKGGETFPLSGYQIVVRSVTSYAANWVLHECFAVKMS